MSKKKAETGQVVISHNPLFPNFNGNSVAFPDEEAPNFREGNTIVLSVEELFNDLIVHHKEEFRGFIEKKAPEILKRSYTASSTSKRNTLIK
ncbi:MAG: hypothetical protein PHW31_01975 [Candidatus Pacebacteria bacterium]|nr:hypothetical protein [Candidatus Paceibacterota bacterium]